MRGAARTFPHRSRPRGAAMPRLSFQVFTRRRARRGYDRRSRVPQRIVAFRGTSPHVSVMKKNQKTSKGPRKQCGALPFRIDDAGRIEVLLVTSRETHRWVIPKGWPIRKLRANQTAAREAYEEAGLAGPVSKEPYGAYTYEKRLKSRAFVPCAVDVFLMQVEKEQKRWPERDERER